MNPDHLGMDTGRPDVLSCSKHVARLPVGTVICNGPAFDYVYFKKVEQPDVWQWYNPLSGATSHLPENLTSADIYLPVRVLTPEQAEQQQAQNEPPQ